MSKMNIIALGVKGKEYLIRDMMATRLTEKEFEEVKQNTNGYFDEWRYIPHKDTDFSWWRVVNKKLTKRHIYRDMAFECDVHGNITEL